jgi:hypothetical protein
MRCRLPQCRPRSMSAAAGGIDAILQMSLDTAVRANAPDDVSSRTASDMSRVLIHRSALPGEGLRVAHHGT